MSARAGHDINYLGLTGALAAIGRPGALPTIPLNLVADFGGGSMLLVVGVLAALMERGQSGRGQVIDAAMVDGVAVLCQLVWSMRGAGDWSDERGDNLLDGGAPFYDTYACADGRFVAVGALEPQFYEQLLNGLGLDGRDLPDRSARAAWPQLRAIFAERFSARSRDEWAGVFSGTDACVTPVVELAEAVDQPHLAARRTLTSVDGVVQASPAPRFSRTPGAAGMPPTSTSVDAVIESWPSPA
jgi:alpha-methylacyl-CoA racemase